MWKKSCTCDLCSPCDAKSQQTKPRIITPSPKQSMIFSLSVEPFKQSKQQQHQASHAAELPTPKLHPKTVRACVHQGRKIAYCLAICILIQSSGLRLRWYQVLPAQDTRWSGMVHTQSISNLESHIHVISFSH